MVFAPRRMFLRGLVRILFLQVKEAELLSRFVKTSIFVALGSRLSKSKLPKWLDPEVQTIGSGLSPCQIALLLFACALILSYYRHSPQ